MELLIGCGSCRQKRLYINGGSPQWSELVTLDINPAHKPDVQWDLNDRPLPFHSDTFDEIHAYEVLEHLSKQGDYRTFFAEWSEWWRILKPGGVMVATSPHWSSPWCWGDPGHTRAYGPEVLTYLMQTEYQAQVGVTCLTDYRFCYKADFDIIHCLVTEDKNFQYCLKSVKPSRYALHD